MLNVNKIKEHVHTHIQNVIMRLLLLTENGQKYFSHLQVKQAVNCYCFYLDSFCSANLTPLKVKETWKDNFVSV